MTPHKDSPPSGKDYATQIALLSQSVDSLTKVVEVAALDIRTIKDSNFVPSKDLQTLFDRMQTTYATQRDLNELDERVKKIEANINKVVFFIILAVLAAVLDVVLRTKGIGP